MMHSCTDCGLVHEAQGDMPESDEVKIARLNADRDVQVARVNARIEADYNETRLDVAKVEAGAEVEAAEVTAEVVGELIAAEGEAAIDAEGDTPEPVIVVAEESNEPAAPPPPEVESSSSGKSKSLWPFG